MWNWCDALKAVSFHYVDSTFHRLFGFLVVVLISVDPPEQLSHAARPIHSVVTTADWNILAGDRSVLGFDERFTLSTRVSIS